MVTTLHSEIPTGHESRPRAPRLSLIRGFELRDGHGDVVPVAQSAQRLVAFVALHDRPVRRLHTSGVLWTDASEHRANSSLRSALWRTPAPGGLPLLEASNTHLWLNPGVEVDFRDSVSRALAILEGRRATPSDWGDTAGSLGADLLPDWYEDWVLVEQERYRQLRLHALEKMCQSLTDVGRYGPALVAGLAAVACEPLRESAQRQVIRTHIREGNLSEALRQYQAYANLLHDELGARPSAALERMVAEALAPASTVPGRDGTVTPLP